MSYASYKVMPQEKSEGFRVVRPELNTSLAARFVKIVKSSHF